VSVDTLRSEGRRAAHGEGVEWLGRVGLVAQGVIYALVGLLALQVAIDGRDAAARPDKEGALQLVAEQPFGKVLLGALALGFAAYALWRFAQAFADREHKGSGAKGLAKRAGYMCLGAWYVALTGLTVATLRESGGSGSSGGGQSEQQTTAGVFELPLGRELVFAAAGGFLIAAGWNVYRALSGKLEKHLRTHELSESARKAVLSIGAVGHIARGVVFGLIGVFLGQAALEYDPQEARGLDGALYELARQPYGPALLAAVAVGLTAYALWCWAQARYRDV
jgi:Domain of Unknown Function (DUF1206)